MHRIGFLAGFISALVPLTALACSCFPLSSAEKYDHAQVVFTGDALRYIKSSRGAAWTVLRFTPVEAWKGANGASIDIEVPTNDGSCSVEILIGHRYLVYAQANSGGTLLTTMCMGTAPLSNAVEDLVYLRGLSPVTPARPDRPKSFADVPSDHMYAQAINDFRSKGYVRGYSDGTFRPERAVSRAEIAQILSEYFLPQDAAWRNEGEHAFTNAGLPFTDIDARAWYNLALRRSYRAGLIQGYADGTFRPAQSVSVAEALKLITQALSIDTPADGAIWYERYVRAAGDRNALPVSIRSLTEPIKRGELVETIWRLSQHVTDRESLSADALLSPVCDRSEDSSIQGVDLRRVRETWLSWYNDQRSALGLKRYTFNPYLTRSASIWSARAAGLGYINHVRDATIGSYNYEAVKAWFQDLGLEFRNVNGVTFTENIGWGPYACTKQDCTDDFIDAIRTTFDFYLAEQTKSYRPHYNAIVNPSFTMMGLGVVVRDGKYYLTAHFGTDLTSNPPRLCAVDGN